MTEAARPARPDEAAALRALARAAYAPYVPRLGFEPPPMRQDFPADIAAAAVWVIGEPPLGFVVARASGEDWLIENVARAPDAPRGLGRRLMAAAEAEGACRGFARAVLYTHERMAENRALYPRLGWTEIARREEDGLPRVFFAKSLAAADAPR
ncbi:MAG: GNAT family N-acetyltransferase [Pseudomonadota bacterium]